MTLASTFGSWMQTFALDWLPVLFFALMCVVGYFAIRPLVKILDLPEAVVSAYVMTLCFVGALSIRNSVTDLWLMIAFGVIGYLFERFKFPVAPLVLGVILGPLTEAAFMNSMISFGNDWTVFFTRPISGFVMVCTALILALPFLQRALSSRKAVPATEGQAPSA